MAGKKREIPEEEKLTFAEARARMRKLKPMTRVEGTGGGAAVPYNEIGKRQSPRVKR